MEGDELKTFLETYRAKGWARVRSGIPLKTALALRDLITEQALHPSIPGESGTPRVNLSDPRTWPHRSARRVVEVLPPGDRPVWRAICTGKGTNDTAGSNNNNNNNNNNNINSNTAAADGGNGNGINAPEESLECATRLWSALDAILGRGAWELPANRGQNGSEIRARRPGEAPLEERHWYCPIAFRERSDPGQGFASLASAVAADEEKQRVEDEKDEKCISTCNSSGSGGKIGYYPGDDDNDPQTQQIAGGRNSDKEKGEPLGIQQASPASFAFTDAQDETLLSAWGKHGASWKRYPRIVDGATGEPATKTDMRRRLWALMGDRDRMERVFRTKDGDTHALPPNYMRKGWPFGTSESQEHWHPVNRRRKRGRGWHIDIGADTTVTECARTVDGERAQGVVVLIALSEWSPGSGGTCFVNGSHRDVARALLAAGKDGIPHQSLNEWAIDYATSGLADGTIRLDYDAPCENDKSGAGNTDANTSIKVCEQATASVGDVILMHPFVVHAGTTNHDPREPRILANGMARLTEDAFERAGRKVPSTRAFLGTMAE